MSSDPLEIPQNVFQAYVNRHPHYEHLRRASLAARTPSQRSAVNRKFAQAACRGTMPDGVTLAEVHALAGIAEGIPWPSVDKPA